MTRAWALRLFALLAAIGLTMTVASADEGANQFATTMTGFEETPPGPFLTDGHGSFHATLQGSTLTYTETFSDLTSPVLFSHIHFAQRGVPGSVIVFLCGGGGKPACPSAGGTVTGTITAADVIARPNQNVSGGDFAGLVRILRSGDAYVNVHTVNFLGGEIRGQIHFGDD